MVGLTLYQALRERAEHQHAAVACVDIDFDLRYSYSQLLGRVDQTAGWWQHLGVNSGDRVLWLAQNSARVLEGLLACAKLGAIFCPVNWRQSTQELVSILNDIEPTLVLWQQQEVGDLAQSMRELADTTRLASKADQPVWIQHDDAGVYEAALAKHQGETAELVVENNDEQAAVLMLYTAAFGGQANGVLLSSCAILAQSRNFGAVRALSPSARYLNVGPLFHVATLLETMATFYVGGTNVFIRRADAAVICDAIANEQCNSAFLLPPVMEKIVALAEQREVNIRCLRSLPGSDAWNALITVDDSLWGRFPYGFGQTETFGYASYRVLGLQGEQDGIGAMGKAGDDVEIAIINEQGELLAAGEVGEIAISGATVMNGYWQRPQLNAQRRSGRWHRSNDLGRLEADGSLSFVGTKQHMIRSGQENIYPIEVERCLQSHPAVAEAAVIGVPDAKWDQAVKALVVLAQGESCDAESLIKHCRERIASYKKPKLVEFVESLPKQGASFDYDLLDKTYGGGGYPGTASTGKH